MYYCERCQSRFNSQRAAFIRDCPRCLLRDDVAAPLQPGSPPRRGTSTVGSGDVQGEDASEPSGSTTPPGAGVPGAAGEAAFPAIPAG